MHKFDQKIEIFRVFSKIVSKLLIPLTFLILIEFPNILHWKSTKKIKMSVVSGQNLGQIMSNIVKKAKKQVM